MLSYILSQAQSAAELPNWATWGILGIVILGFITKQIVPGWFYSDAKQQIEDLRQENARLVELVLKTQSDTLPAITASTAAVAEALHEIRRRE